MPRRPGSSRGQINTSDLLNSFKHVSLVAAASVLTPLAQGAPLDWKQLQASATTACATGILTLITRWGQDNR